MNCQSFITLLGRCCQFLFSIFLQLLRKLRGNIYAYTRCSFRIMSKNRIFFCFGFSARGILVLTYCCVDGSFDCFGPFSMPTYVQEPSMFLPDFNRIPSRPSNCLSYKVFTRTYPHGRTQDRVRIWVDRYLLHRRFETFVGVLQTFL